MSNTIVIEKVYNIHMLEKPMKIDGDWDKKEWKNVTAILIENHMGEFPAFIPFAEAKMIYDEENLYLIFRVKDSFVHSTITNINGPVSENSCVEFFFAPDIKFPLKYFSLEINAGGTPLFFYTIMPRLTTVKLGTTDIRLVNIHHSMPKVVDPEIKDKVTWTIECSIPLSILRKFANFKSPLKGTTWKGNFYKTGSKTSNPNYMTWAKIDNPVPNFHLPQFFGTLIFD